MIASDQLDEQELDGELPHPLDRGLVQGAICEAGSSNAGGGRG